MLVNKQLGYKNNSNLANNVPLGADKMHDASKGVFSVFSNDKNKNYDTIQSAWEFAKNQEQPQVCRSIRLGVTLF